MPTKSKVHPVSRERSTAAPEHGSTRDEIERRAYFIFLDRGATHGWDVEDWLQAEYELKKGYDLNRKEKRIKPSERPNAKLPTKTPRNRKKSRD